MGTLKIFDLFGRRQHQYLSSVYLFSRDIETLFADTLEKKKSNTKMVKSIYKLHSYKNCVPVAVTNFIILKIEATTKKNFVYKLIL